MTPPPTSAAGIVAPPDDDERPCVVVAVNRKAGSGRGRESLACLCRALESRGYRTAAIGTLDEALTRIAREQAAQRLHAAIAAGGDGTLNALLNGTPPGTPLAVFALGTENLMARYLRMPRNPAEVADVVAARRTRRFDCGRVGERLFLLTLSVGFDAAVVRRLSEVRTGNIGRLSYLAPIGSMLFAYRFPTLRVTVVPPNGTSEPGRTPTVCRWCFVQNLPAYAAGLNFTPDAAGDDGLLDYCLFEHGSRRHLLTYAWHVARGSHLRRDDCRVGRAVALRIESDAADVPVQIDGDPAGTLPVEVATSPGRATLLVP